VNHPKSPTNALSRDEVTLVKTYQVLLDGLHVNNLTFLGCLPNKPLSEIFPCVGFTV